MKKEFEPKKILIPIDFSETSKIALEHAAQICEKFDSKLYLLHVYTSFNMSVLPNVDAVSYQPDEEEIKSAITDEMNVIGQKFQEKYNIGYQIELRQGSISKEISRAAEEAKADMIVMGTHGVSGFEEFFLGSNAYRTVTSAKVPVLTVQGHADPCGYDRIVVPIDSSTHTRDKVSQVIALAKKFNSRVFIAGTITEEHEEEIKIFRLKIKQIEEYLDHLDILHESELIHGDDVAKMTLKFAKDKKANLIAIMTEQEPSTGLFMGPYAQQVVNHSKVPVLSVTPISVVESYSQGQLAGDYRPFNL